MEPVDLVAGEALEEPVGEHRAGAAEPLLGRLEDEHRGAVEGPRLGEVARRAEQHRGVPVMAAGVHLAGLGRGVGKPGRLLDRQRVHVGAKPDAAIVAALPFEHADHPGPADAAMHRDAPGGELFGDDRGGALLLEADLRMGVEVVPPGDEVVGEAGDAVEDGHGGS